MTRNNDFDKALDTEVAHSAYQLSATELPKEQIDKRILAKALQHLQTIKTVAPKTKRWQEKRWVGSIAAGVLFIGILSYAQLSILLDRESTLPTYVQESAEFSAQTSAAQASAPKIVSEQAAMGNIVLQERRTSLPEKLELEPEIQDKDVLAELAKADIGEQLAIQRLRQEKSRFIDDEIRRELQLAQSAHEQAEAEVEVEAIMVTGSRVDDNLQSPEMLDKEYLASLLNEFRLAQNSNQAKFQTFDKKDSTNASPQAELIDIQQSLFDYLMQYLEAGGEEVIDEQYWQILDDNQQQQLHALREAKTKEKEE